jgi:ribosomal protein S12 methylthiotransferase
LLVISQDTSAYGVDVKYRTGFHQGRTVKTRMTELVRELGDMGVWVRLHYVYPYPHVDEVIPLMAEGKLLPYLDIPFQHASPRVLKAMKRPANAENVIKRLDAWRAICPDIAIRSTFITGFPGETEEDFQMLLDFIDEAQLDRVGCFTYSPVEGATANDLPDHVAPELAEERKARFMEKQAAISAAKLQAKIGKQMTVLIDEIDEQGAVARSYADAPEIDGLVYIGDDEGLSVGDLVQVEITDADEYDLWASPLALEEQ